MFLKIVVGEIIVNSPSKLLVLQHDVDQAEDHLLGLLVASVLLGVPIHRGCRRVGQGHDLATLAVEASMKHRSAL